MKNSQKGFFGKFGGRFVPEALEKLLIENKLEVQILGLDESIKDNFKLLEKLK